MVPESLKKLSCASLSFSTLTYVSGTLGIIQGVIVLGMSWYFSKFYLNDNIPQLLDYPLWALITRASTIDFDDTMKGLVVTVALFSSIWLASSFALIASNYFQCVIGISQWIVTTLIITLLDISFFIYFISQTSDMLGTLFTYQTGENQPDDVTREDLMRGYLMLLFTFGKGGILLWIVNIALAYLCYRRATQILSQPKTEESSYITLGPKLKRPSINGASNATKLPFQSNLNLDLDNGMNMSNASVNRGYHSDGVY